MVGALGRKELQSIFVQDALLRAGISAPAVPGPVPPPVLPTVVGLRPLWRHVALGPGYERMVKFTSAGLSERLLKEAVLIKIFKQIIRLLWFGFFCLSGTGLVRKHVLNFMLGSKILSYVFTFLKKTTTAVCTLHESK